MSFNLIARRTIVEFAELNPNPRISIALGASLGEMAGPFLKAAVDSLQAVLDQIEVTRRELQIAMFGIGVDSIVELRQTDRLVKLN